MYNLFAAKENGETEMDKAMLIKYIADNYGAEPDYPWTDAPEWAVFRHGGNGKWFALIMNVSADKLGLEGAGKISIVNLKCGTLLVGSLVAENGFFPAYHMNKTHWISAALDGTADDETIKMLLELSYEASRPKPRCTRAERK